MKTCSKCKTSKPLTEYSHKRPSGRKPGLQPRCKACAIEDSRDWYLANKERAKNTRLLSEYGITLDQYYEMLSLQDNSCLICSSKFSFETASKRPCVDHCHIHGHVRGILCNECNRGLGYFHDDTKSLAKAIQYLKKR